MVFTLTVDQDIFTTGTGNDLFLAPIGGIFGFQPTLTPFDTLIDSGKNNALQAFFAGSLLGGPTIVGGLTIQGIQTWQFENAGTTAVLINGGVNVGGPGPSNGGAGNAGTNPGVTTITIINSSAGVAVGGNGFGAPGAGTGLANLVQTVNVANITGGFTKVVVGAGQFTGTDPIALNIANLPAGYSINIGPDSGTTGYQTWNIMANDNGAGATVDTISLGAFTATNAKTINLSDGTGFTGGLTLNANTHSGSGSGNWAKVVTINGASLAGVLTVTGAENGNTGFLAANTTALKSITGGTGGAFFDLSSLTAAAAHALTTVNGGSGLGEVVFNNTVLTTNATIALSNIDVLDDAADTQGGTINMANFPLVTGVTPVLGGLSMAELQFVAADGDNDPSLTSNLLISNGLTNFFVQLNEMAYNGHNVTITAGLANINGGNDTLAVGLSDNGSPASFTVNNYTTVDLLLPTNGGTVFGSGLVPFIDNPVIGTVGAAFNIYDAGGGTPDDPWLGKLLDSSLTNANVGISTVTITAPTPLTINDFGAGRLLLGATNVSTINATSTSHLVMDVAATGGGAATLPFFENPVTAYGITVNGSANGNSLIQGVSGTIALDTAGNALLGAINAELSLQAEFSDRKHLICQNCDGKTLC